MLTMLPTLLTMPPLRLKKLLLRLTLLPQDNDSGSLLPFRRKRKPAAEPESRTAQTPNSAKAHDSTRRHAPAKRRPAAVPHKKPEHPASVQHKEVNGDE